MRTKRCWACDRRRPMARMNRNRGEPPTCLDRKSCVRGLHRHEAQIARAILSDHDERDRPVWRRRLARHVKLSR